MLHLGKIEKRSKSLSLGLAEVGIVVEKVEAKVDKATRGRLTINEDVSFWQMPPSWAHKQLSCFIIQFIHFVSGLIMECYCSIHCIPQIYMAPH